jgi:hypothetical protein
MTPERYKELQHGPDPQRLTQEEMVEGWHWCPEMDGLLCTFGSDDCFCTSVISWLEAKPIIEASTPEDPVPMRLSDGAGNHIDIQVHEGTVNIEPCGCTPLSGCPGACKPIDAGFEFEFEYRPNPYTEEQKEDMFQTLLGELGLCNCGDPVSTIMYIGEGMDIVANKAPNLSNPHYDAWMNEHHWPWLKEHFRDDEECYGQRYLFFCNWLEQKGYAEHGSNIASSHLTEDGEQVLAQIKTVMENLPENA